MGSEKHQSVGPVQCIQRIASYSALYHTGSAIIVFDCFTFDVFECFETGCCTPQSTYFNEGALLPQADMPYQGVDVARVQKGGVYCLTVIILI